MQILEIKQHGNGAHDNQTVYGVDFPIPEGWCLVPEDMQPLQNLPYGNFTTETISDPGSPYGDEYEQLKTWEPLPVSPPPPTPEPTPAEKRKQAYETEQIINWPENSATKIAVDEANQLWLDYTAEGKDEVANKLRDLIALAKADIRERYPD